MQLGTARIHELQKLCKLSTLTESEGRVLKSGDDVSSNEGQTKSKKMFSSTVLISIHNQCMESFESRG